MNNNEYIEYKGHKILKKEYVTVEEDYREFDSNSFELSTYDLKLMLEDLKEKEEELKRNDKDFKDLRYHLYAVEDHTWDDYCPHDAGCEVSFKYDVLETDKESEKRIKEQKAWIDKKIQEKECQEAAQELVDRYAIEQAMKLLNEKGYSVTKN